MESRECSIGGGAYGRDPKIGRLKATLWSVCVSESLVFDRGGVVFDSCQIGTTERLF